MARQGKGTALRSGGLQPAAAEIATRVLGARAAPRPWASPWTGSPARFPSEGTSPSGSPFGIALHGLAGAFSSEGARSPAPDFGRRSSVRMTDAGARTR
jgi:hypothetical protein